MKKFKEFLGKKTDIDAKNEKILSMPYEEFKKYIPPEHYLQLKQELHQLWYQEFEFENLYAQPIEEGFAKYIPHITLIAIAISIIINLIIR